MDKLSLANPSLEVVSGNVMSTGLGALEILGKRAVDVISDVASGYRGCYHGSIRASCVRRQTLPASTVNLVNLVHFQ